MCDLLKPLSHLYLALHHSLPTFLCDQRLDLRFRLNSLCSLSIKLRLHLHQFVPSRLRSCLGHVRCVADCIGILWPAVRRCNGYSADTIEAIWVMLWSARWHLLCLFKHFGSWNHLFRHSILRRVEVVLRLRGGRLLDPGGLRTSVGVNQVDLLLLAASDPLIVCLDFVITSLLFLLHFILLIN